ncbi:MAG: antibiotic biosynthesis monooxygenase [Bacteroidota bacterium]
MKKSFLFIAFFALFSCTNENTLHSSEKYIVETSVKVKAGTTQNVLDLFKRTNPLLVENESDWLKASFATDEEKSLVIVRAEWKSKEAYINFSVSDRFSQTMQDFRKYFDGRPEVHISKVLFEM